MTVQNIIITAKNGPKGSSGEGYLIETHDDMLSFLEDQKQAVSEDMNFFIKNAVPVDRWDHHNPKMIRAIFKLGLIQILRDEITPITTFNIALREYAVAMFDWYEKYGEPLVVNKAGGFMPLEAIDYEIDYEVVHSKDFNIVEGSTMVTLENDPVVDKDSPFQNVTSIVNLRSFMENNDFVRALNEAAQAGAKKVAVFTSLLDRQQVRDYTKAVSESNIDAIEWVIRGKPEGVDFVLDVADSFGLVAAASLYKGDEKDATCSK